MCVWAFVDLDVCVGGGLGPQGGRYRGQPGSVRARGCTSWEAIGLWCVSGELCPRAGHLSPKLCSLSGGAQVWRDDYL